MPTGDTAISNTFNRLKLRKQNRPDNLLISVYSGGGFYNGSHNYIVVSFYFYMFRQLY